MSTTPAPVMPGYEPPLTPAPTVASGLGFLLAALGLAVAAGLLAGGAPIAFSIATVFLFAGPHNWLEARYFLARMPARWGKLTGYFTFSFVGILTLAAGFWVLVWLVSTGTLGDPLATYGLAVWNTALLLWIATLVEMRGRTNPRRDWGWIWPVSFLLIAANWTSPFTISVALVYAHPLMAFWLLARELRRSRPEWLPALYLFMALLPLFILALWLQLGNAPPLTTTSELDAAIVHHAGSDFLRGLSSHFLVATHTFLEMLHYGIWVVAIPLVGYRFAAFDVNRMPLANNGPTWRRGLQIAILAGVGIMLILWACFLVDYTTTRNIYFTVALLHVLAEVPFLLRAL